MLYTTVNLMIKDGGFKQDQVRFLQEKVGSEYDHDMPIALIEILDLTDGKHDWLDSGIWMLRCCTESEKAQHVSKVFALLCAEHIEYFFVHQYPDDTRVHDCNAAVRRYLSGDASIEETRAAGFASFAAARKAAADTYPTVAAAAWAAAAASIDASAAACNIEANTAWAAWAAARIAVDALGDAERAWQFKTFRELLEQ